MSAQPAEFAQIAKDVVEAVVAHQHDAQSKAAQVGDEIALRRNADDEVRMEAQYFLRIHRREGRNLRDARGGSRIVGVLGNADDLRPCADCEQVFG